MFTGKPVSRTHTGLELLLGLGIIKMFGALLKTDSSPEATEARPPKAAKGKTRGMPEPEPPEKILPEADSPEKVHGYVDEAFKRNIDIIISH